MTTLQEVYIEEAVPYEFEDKLNSWFGDSWHLRYYDHNQRYEPIRNFPVDVVLEVYDFLDNLLGKVSVHNRFEIEADHQGRHIVCRPESIKLIAKSTPDPRQVNDDERC